MQLAIIFAAVGIFAIIAYGDVRTRRIPNALSLAIAAFGLLRLLLVHDAAAACHTLAAATVILAAGFLLFWRGVIGGGDAKLLAATALLIGYHDLFGFLLLMSLCGAALALAILARDKLARAPQHPTVPYGVAIATSAAITLILETSAR